MLGCCGKQTSRSSDTDSPEHEKAKKLPGSDQSDQLRVSGFIHRSNRFPVLDSAHRSYPLPVPDDSKSSAGSFHVASTSRGRGHLPVIQNPDEGQLGEGSSGKPPKWKKVKLLGKDTFADVYLGVNSEDEGLMCVIKEFKAVGDDGLSTESLTQISQELELLSDLSHANIIAYYGSELIAERLSAYFECVRGVSIHKLLQQYGVFGELVIQNYTRQILACLAYLNRQNIVHRDVKGANILVGMDGEIRFTEFGMAIKVTCTTKMTALKGSPYWMAPEIVNSSGWYGHTADIWSLGCTVIEMASSKPPWSQYEEAEAMLKIGNTEDLPEIPSHLSIDARNFISLCLRREPSARPLAHQLLHHPFVRNPCPVTKAINMKITREAFPNFDEICTPWGF